MKSKGSEIKSYITEYENEDGIVNEPVREEGVFTGEY
jgi:hypothetical protein